MDRSTARVRRRVCQSLPSMLLIASFVAPLAARAQELTEDTTFKIRYKGVTITPVGFAAGEAVFRSRNETADMGSSFNSIPFTHSTNANLTEFRGSGRQSRFGTAVDGKIGDVKTGGYFETDFLSAGASSNSNESNSYTLRIRQFFGKVQAGGTEFDAGEMWSLLTTDKAGVSPRSEAVPLTIDAQYNVGFDWARQWGFRLSQRLAPGAYFAIAAEEPQMSFGGHGTPANVFIGNTGGSQLNATTNYSTDVAPDVIAKLAFEPGFGHWELKALGRVFRDRIVDTACTFSTRCSYNATRLAGGVGVGFWLPFMYEKRDVLDIGISGLWGNGIGRYGTSMLIDATARPDGTIVPVRAAHALLSIEAHPTRKLDIFAYGGTEYAYREQFTNAAGGLVGYGLPNAVNSGCDKEFPNTGNFAPGAPGALCVGDTRDLYEVSLGLWYSFFRGPMGRFAWGLEYHYVSKNTWSGANSIQPQAIENMAYTLFRYYLP